MGRVSATSGAKRTVNAQAVVADIENGMTELDLMKKYRLSSQGILSLLHKLVSADLIGRAHLDAIGSRHHGTVTIAVTRCPRCGSVVQGEDARCPHCASVLKVESTESANPVTWSGADRHGGKTRKHTVQADEVMKDIRSGMSDSALMKKYKLSSKGLQSLFKKLVERGFLEKSVVEDRTMGADKTVKLNFIACPICNCLVVDEFMNCPHCGAELANATHQGTGWCVVGNAGQRSGKNIPEALDPVRDDEATAQEQEPLATGERGDDTRLKGSLRSKIRVGVSAMTTPAVSQGIIFVGGVDGYLRAVDLVTGDTQWTFKAEQPIQSTVTVANGGVYFGTNAGKLHALDATTGTVQWTMQAGGPVRGGLTVADGTIYFGCDDHNIYAVDVETGTQKWKLATGRPVRSSPAAAQGLLYFGSNDRKLYALT